MHNYLVGVGAGRVKRLRVYTAVGGTVSTPVSSLPGLQEIALHRHDVPA